MMKTILLASLLTGACVADLGDPDPTIESTAKTGGTADPAADKAPPVPPIPVPRIAELAWHWNGCNPASANALPFGITVDVFVDDGTGVITSCNPSPPNTDPPTCAIQIKGIVDGCQSFDGSGQFSPCTGLGSAIAKARQLDVAATDADGHSDEVFVNVSDCVDDKWIAFVPPKY